MSAWTFIWRSLRFHARAHLGVVLGAIVGSAALIGALIIGDSVRGSLHALALLRLGNVDVALVATDRLFRDQLADDLQNGQTVAKGAGAFEAAPVLIIQGTAADPDGSARANQVQILGVDSRLARLQPGAPDFGAATNDVAILNSHLAAQLGAKTGDTVLVRVRKPSLLSREAPITPQSDFSVALRLKVAGIVDDEHFGRFSLRASQLAPLNAFVPLSLLQTRLEQPGRANLILAAHTDRAEAERRLQAAWQLSDAELELRPVNGGKYFELRSRRVFLDPPVARAAESVSPQASKILTYFVNELRDGQASTPYSMVAALGAPVVPPDMKDDEILINQWLADDLQAKAGDELRLAYYVPSPGQRLEVRTDTFRVRGIVPLEGVYADRELMPEFPGIAKAEKTQEWEAGFPIDMDRIRPKDEQYWDQYRGTPKAFVTLAAGQRMWTNRFGNLTALRFPAADWTLASLEGKLKASLNPAAVDLTFRPVREQALAASSQAQDFGQLFLGFSFFVILAALILMALLFQFSLEQRAEEVGTLLAVGFRPGKIRLLLLGEGAVLSLLGGLLGVLGGSFTRGSCC